MNHFHLDNVILTFKIFLYGIPLMLQSLFFMQENIRHLIYYKDKIAFLQNLTNLRSRSIYLII